MPIEIGPMLAKTIQDVAVPLAFAVVFWAFFRYK